jgi:hypothetical protein
MICFSFGREGADPERGERDDRELPPVRQLHGDDVAAPDVQML